MDDLYHPNIGMRYLATERFQNDGKKHEEFWPRACWGSANAWIVLVGPSPGAPMDPKNPWPGGPKRPVDDHAQISLSASVVDFPNGRYRNERWMSLIDQFTGNRKHTLALAAICNLDWQQQTDQDSIPDERLRDGCTVVEKVINETRPRIVAALTVR